MSTRPGPTLAQRSDIADLGRQLHIAGPALDRYCTERFGATVKEMSPQQASRLLSEMVRWTVAPAELRRAMGQLDLFGGAL